MPENVIHNKKVESSVAVPQSGDLHLFVYDRLMHPELFKHFGNFRVEQTRYFADIWIVGLSHVCTVTCGQQVISELIVRDSDLFPSRGVLSRFRLKGERDHERKTNDGWQYLVSTQVETMEEALYKSVHMDLQRHAAKRGWYRVYEQWSDGELMPFTYIDHEARDSEFHLHAFHAFPQERTIVKTQSIFEMPD